MSDLVLVGAVAVAVYFIAGNVGSGNGSASPTYADDALGRFERGVNAGATLARTGASLWQTISK